MALIAVVGAAIGTVTTLALRENLVDKLDDQLRVSLDMALRGPGAGKAARENSLGFVLAPGSPLGAAGIRLDSDGKVIGTARSAAVGVPTSTTASRSPTARRRRWSRPPTGPPRVGPTRPTWNCRSSAATGC